MKRDGVVYNERIKQEREYAAGRRKELLEAMYSRMELQSVLAKVKEASECLYGNKLDRIILFGSYARGDNDDESDIDIMIILNCDVSELRTLRRTAAGMASDISLESEVFISILLRDRKHFEENVELLPFYQNIVREGVAVYG